MLESAWLAGDAIGSSIQGNGTSVTVTTTDATTTDPNAWHATTRLRDASRLDARTYLTCEIRVGVPPAPQAPRRTAGEVSLTRDGFRLPDSPRW